MDENKTDLQDDEKNNEDFSPTQEAKKMKIEHGECSSTFYKEIDELQGSSSDSKTENTSHSKLENLDSKTENVDSGICADKSESTSVEDQESSNGEKSLRNEVMVGAPSSNNFEFILSIKRARRALTRNYRRRSRDEDDNSTDNNDSLTRDSDDLSEEQRVTGGSDDETSRPIVYDASMSDDTRSEVSYNENERDINMSSSSSDIESGDSDDSMEQAESDIDDQTSEDGGGGSSQHNENEEDKLPSVLLKPKPKHNWFLIKELLHREMGLTMKPGKASKTDVLFEHRFYGSKHVVQRLELMYKLEKHRGCVNAINFHPEGHLLASGSDDLNVVVWDWTTNTPLQTLKTGHRSNVFQSKFLYLNAQSQLNIVTCARDGQVRLVQCPPSGGGSTIRRRLASHSRSAHKLHVSPHNPHIVLSAGEDGKVILSDVRTQDYTTLFTVEDKNKPVALYSIHGHPLDTHQIVVAGRDSYVRVYDKRKSMSKPLSLYCPSFFSECEDNKSASKRGRFKLMSLYITCAVYNYNGSEILASYNDDDIYLFDTVNDVYDPDSNTTKHGFTHRYSGHRNNETIKGVAYFGPHSEHIISGSDCSNIYIWDKNTEAIVQFMPGDDHGVVNCIEPHPRCPVLASSGLDEDIKIWVPSNDEEPKMSGLKQTVKSNTKGQLRSPLFNDFLPSMYSRLTTEHLRSEDDSNPILGGNIDFDGNVCSIV